MILSLLILNKAGGLIYQRDFTNTLTKLSSNDYLVLAGTFHGVHAITARLSPLGSSNSSGLEVMESDTFRMQCFQTLTGIKFLIFTDPQQPNTDVILKRIYELYADYVMKNPFYQIEMPIRCEAFDRHLVAYIKPKQ
ncbi:Sybindin-like protein [Peziza echinospora]|nr:Sybindin-like protein [Peziza echinospora]